jgi:hypothetical protein
MRLIITCMSVLLSTQWSHSYFDQSGISYFSVHMQKLLKALRLSCAYPSEMKMQDTAFYHHPKHFHIKHHKMGKKNEGSGIIKYISFFNKRLLVMC